MNSQIVTVNLVPGLSTPAVIRVSQYDVGRPLTIRVLDGTGAASFGSSVTATIVGTKPSGLGFTQSGLITGNTVTLNTTLAMTQECGMIPAEISFTTASPATVIGTANFILAVEPSPHPDGTTDGTYETMADLQTQLNGLDTRVTALEAGGGGGSGLTDDVKTALLQIAQKVAYIDADGQDYYDDLYDALYNDTTRSVLLVLSHVSSSNTQSTVEVGDSYTTALTASTNYTINSVTVTMGGVDITSTSYSSGTITIPSVTGNIVITATAVLTATSITATYTQSGTVYTTTPLNDLKSDLVVTANYSGGGSDTVPSSDYTLSGTLTVGTSTVTVSYGGLTTTFSVTVSSAPVSYLYNWDFTQSLTDSVQGTVAELGHYGTSTDPTQGSTGLVFDAANQYCLLGTMQVKSRTFEFDIAEMDVQATNQHTRVFMCTTVSSQGTGALIYRYGASYNYWSCYNGSTWSDPYSTTITRNGLSGTTVKLVFDADAYCDLYVDGTYIGRSTVHFTTGSGAIITLGGITSTTSYSYNMRITSLKIY